MADGTHLGAQASREFWDRLATLVEHEPAILGFLPRDDLRFSFGPPQDLWVPARVLLSARTRRR